jgi:IclR family pca regulon transcriptional regulator
MLTTGLDILRILAEADGPLTATAIAERVGLHVSNVSRTLRVLAEHGYVRKPTYHSFAPDLGVLCLAGAAAARLPVIRAGVGPVRALARRTGLQASLAALHQEQVVYLHRTQPDGAGVTAMAGGFPLHRSVVGLRLLIDLPAKQAVDLLARSQRTHGWDRPTDATPADPRACLAAARSRMRGGVLRTDHWDAPGDAALALGLAVAGHPPLALGLDGPAERLPPDHLALLAEAARELTTALETIP